MELTKPALNNNTKPEKGSRWGFRGMTVRNWLELLVMPLVLSLITVAFTVQQGQTQRTIEEQRAQDQALQVYLDQMDSSMLGKDLRASPQDNEVQTLARARTLTVLQRLDWNRNAQVVRSLMEGNLKRSEIADKEPVLNLKDAGLTYAIFGDADLTCADLSQTDLSDANLRNANLAGADLSGANLSDADLSGAGLAMYVFLEDADVSDADFSGTDLSGKTVSQRTDRLLSI